jgi:flagellar basal body-associated protein FliL
VSYDETPTPPAPTPPPPADAPAAAAPQPQSGTSGWLIAFTVVVVLALGGLAAAIISKGDSGKTATTPTVTAKTTTVQNTTTVTTPAAPANVTVAPNVTLNSSGAPQPVQSGAQTTTAAKTTSTP